VAGVLPEVDSVIRRDRRPPADVQPVFPDILGSRRDPSNVRRVWRKVHDEAQMDGMVSHTLRKTIASFLDDSDCPPARSVTNSATPSQGSVEIDVGQWCLLTIGAVRSPAKIT
jgi:hypothetical protein